MMQERDMILKEGVIVDATIVQALKCEGLWGAIHWSSKPPG